MNSSSFVAMPYMNKLKKERIKKKQYFYKIYLKYNQNVIIADDKIYLNIICLIKYINIYILFCAYESNSITISFKCNG